MSASRRLIITVDSPTGHSSNLPSHSELAEALAQAIPKEMWIDHVDDAEGWGVVSFNTPVSIASSEDYRFSDMDTELEKRRAESALLNAQITDLREEVALRDRGLNARDERILNLQEKNENQAETIKAGQQAVSDQREVIVDLEDRLLIAREAHARVVMERDNLIARVKEAMVTIGVTVGWGDDEDLTVLEDHAANIKADVNDLIDRLDTVRTAR